MPIETEVAHLNAIAICKTTLIQVNSQLEDTWIFQTLKRSIILRISKRRFTASIRNGTYKWQSVFAFAHSISFLIKVPKHHLKTGNP